jgi:type VI secretion system protein VasG
MGKTTLARLASERITGSARKVLHIPGSALSAEHALVTYLGSSRAYVGYGEGGTLVNFIKQSGFGALIVTDPQEAHPAFLRLLREIMNGSFKAGDGETIHTRRLMLFLVINTEIDKAGSIGFRSGGRTAETEAGTSRERLVQALGGDLYECFGEHRIVGLPPLGLEHLRAMLRRQVDEISGTSDVRIRMADDACAAAILRRKIRNARQLSHYMRHVLEPLVDEQVQSGNGNIEAIDLYVDDNGLPVIGRQTNRRQS